MGIREMRSFENHIFSIDDNKVEQVIIMRCTRCHSPRLIKFIDGFGHKRVFCRDCGGSFLDNFESLIPQTNLLRFGEGGYRIRVSRPHSPPSFS